jgi:DNA-binding transcriptional MerR regulator
MEKIYYSIGEVAEKTGVNPSTIRYWEKNFVELTPDKTSKGTRIYKQSDIEILRLINHLVRDRGMTVRGARQMLKDNRDKTMNNWEIVKKLQEIKEMLNGIVDETED